MLYKVLCRSGLLEGEEADLSAIGAQTIVATLSTEGDIIGYANDIDAAIVGATEPYTRRVIEALKKCKVISRLGIGCNNIDLAAATEYGIPVAYVPDASIIEVSDHAIALLLCFSRKLIPISQAIREGAWQPGQKDILPLRRPISRLSEQTLGLVGLGRIGGAVCKKARVFGMRVIIYDPYLSVATIQQLGAEQADFDKILIDSDYVSLHAPLTEETKHLFGLEQFKKMKPTAYLINTARGGLIDEKALIAALSKGYIAGAGLDVTDPEPPKPDNPLLQMENVIATGHTAFYSQSSARELRQRTVGAVIAALTGQWPQILANPEVRDRSNCRLTK